MLSSEQITGTTENTKKTFFLDFLYFFSKKEDMMQKNVIYKKYFGIISMMSNLFKNTNKETFLQNNNIVALSSISSISKISFLNNLTTYKKNNDIVSGMRWVATLDGKTCFYCANLDGKQWDLNEKPINGNIFLFPRNKPHPECRCTLVPILKSFRDIGIDIDEFPTSTRASMNGQISENIYFPEWFNMQKDIFKKQYLGDDRYNLYRLGKLFFSDLVTMEGIERSIDELLTITKNRNKNLF